MDREELMDIIEKAARECRDDLDLSKKNPQWLAERISRVLDSKVVTQTGGILTRQHMDELWSDMEPYMRSHVLELMEKLDLSYSWGQKKEASLIVEALPLNPPSYRDKWDRIKKEGLCKEISLNFYLSSIPAGIPTWFIARARRFTTETHWRFGALFKDFEGTHLGLVDTCTRPECVRLQVRGPAPHNFLALLRDGLELTLARFPGLVIRRTVPCPGHGGKRCKHEFNLKQLERAFEKGITMIECPEAFAETSVTEMLLGLHVGLQEELLLRMDGLRAHQEKILSKIRDIKSEELPIEVSENSNFVLTQYREYRELSQRIFLQSFDQEQMLAESHCPNVFTLTPKEGQTWGESIAEQKMILQLYCQAPRDWHPTEEGGCYEINEPAHWLKAMAPYVIRLAKVIKFLAPMTTAGAFVVRAAPDNALTDRIELTEKLAKMLLEGEHLTNLSKPKKAEGIQRVGGASLRALRILLNDLDPYQNWGDLKKIRTPEGHYLWLCKKHAKIYMRQFDTKAEKEAFPIGEFAQKRKRTETSVTRVTKHQ